MGLNTGQHSANLSLLVLKTVSKGVLSVKQSKQENIRGPMCLNLLCRSSEAALPCHTHMPRFFLLLVIATGLVEGFSIHHVKQTLSSKNVSD